MAPHSVPTLRTQAGSAGEAALKAQHEAALSSARDAAAAAEAELRRQLGNAEKGAEALTKARDALATDVQVWMCMCMCGWWQCNG